MIIERKCVERGANESWEPVEVKYFINVMENRGFDPYRELKRLTNGWIVKTISFHYREKEETE